MDPEQAKPTAAATNLPVATEIQATIDEAMKLIGEAMELASKAQLDSISDAQITSRSEGEDKKKAKADHVVQSKAFRKYQEEFDEKIRRARELVDTVDARIKEIIDSGYAVAHEMLLKLAKENPNFSDQTQQMRFADEAAETLKKQLLADARKARDAYEHRMGTLETELQAANLEGKIKILQDLQNHLQKWYVRLIHNVISIFSFGARMNSAERREVVKELITEASEHSNTLMQYLAEPEGLEATKQKQAGKAMVDEIGGKISRLKSGKRAPKAEAEQEEYEEYEEEEEESEQFPHERL